MVVWFVWSSGLEKWERIHVTTADIASFVFKHSKTLNGHSFAVCVDPLGRYVGGLHYDVEWEITTPDDRPDHHDQVALIASMSKHATLEIDTEIIAHLPL